MSENPLITIAIPTYNRTSNLRKLITQLQKENQSKFNLIICDDASPDDPTQMVNEFIPKMPNLKYIRNDINLGFSGNVCQLYDLAETPFIWFICDDDQIIAGAVHQIHRKLQEIDPSVAIVNHKWTNPYGLEKTAGVTSDKIYNDIDEIKDYSVLMRTTFLSALILKKSISSDKIKQTNYHNNVFIQISLALMILSKNLRLAELSILAIDRHVGFNYGEFFKFYIVDPLRAIHAVNHIFDNKKFIKWFRNEIPIAFQLYLSQKLGIFKYRGIPTLQTIKEIFMYYGIYSLLIFLFIPAYYLVPTSILKYIYKSQLEIYHDKNKANEIYEQNINRAYKDRRKTKFTEYR